MFMKIPKDSTILISSGEYSSYSIYGVYKALVDIDPNVIKDEWVSEHPEQMETYHFKESEFMDHLINKGLIELQPSLEWYLGAYSCISNMDVYNGKLSFS